MAGDSKALERYKDEFDPYQAFLVNGRSRQSGHSEDIEKTPKDLRELDLNKGNGGGSHGTAYVILPKGQLCANQDTIIERRPDRFTNYPWRHRKEESYTG